MRCLPFTLVVDRGSVNEVAFYRSQDPGPRNFSNHLHMKGKKFKRSQHAVQNIYEKYFGIRKPYQIVVDSQFCIESLKKRISPVDALQEVFGGPVKLMTTQCICTELRKYDAENEAGSFFVARRFEMIKHCGHNSSKDTKTGAECIKDLVGKTNPQHYCVAAQDPQLRRDIREIYGVPTMFILRDTVLMEPPTEKTLQVVKQKEAKKLLKPARDDIKLLKKLSEKKQEVSGAPADQTEEADASVKSKPKPKKKKRKQKGVNPLSCKKKKPKPAAPVPSKVETKKKKPRKRRPKKKASTATSNAE